MHPRERATVSISSGDPGAPGTPAQGVPVDTWPCRAESQRRELDKRHPAGPFSREVTSAPPPGKAEGVEERGKRAKGGEGDSEGTGETKKGRRGKQEFARGRSSQQGSLHKQEAAWCPAPRLRKRGLPPAGGRTRNHDDGGQATVSRSLPLRVK